MKRGFNTFQCCLLACLASLGLALTADTSTRLSEPWNTFNVTPVNTAGRVGDDVILECTLSDYTYSHQLWTEYVTSVDGSGTVISVNDSIYHRNYDHYDISGMYDLVIYNISYADAGIYSCYDDGDDSYVYVQLLVLDNVTCPTGNDLTILEAGNFSLCGVSGAGAWPPVVNVTIFNDDLDSSYELVNSSANGDTFAFDAVKVANRSLNNETLQYRCDVYFPPPTTLPKDTANNSLWVKNAPSLLDDSCAKDYYLNVQYFSGDISFLIDGTSYAPQFNLTLTSPPQYVECVSDANPAVNCTVDATLAEGGVQVNTCLLQIPDNACTNFECNFKCTASNFVNPTGAFAEISFIA